MSKLLNEKQNCFLATLEIVRRELASFNRAERLGWLDNVGDWLVAREGRNRLVHEYITSAKQFADDLLSTKPYLGMFQDTYNRGLNLAIKHCGVSENELVSYLIGSADKQCG